MSSIVNRVETLEGQQGEIAGVVPLPKSENRSTPEDVGSPRPRFIIDRGARRVEVTLPSQAEVDTQTQIVFGTEPAKVVRLPIPQPAKQQFTLLQQWEGTVEGVSDGKFFAVIHDLTSPSSPEEQASFPLEEIPDADRSLVVPGAVFYWTIGYEVTVSGTRKTVSMIRFRRLPAWSRSEISKIEREAKRFLKIFDSHS